MTAQAWQRYYDALPDGRFRITTPALMALEATHPHRVLITLLRGNPAKVLLLDKPLQLKEKAYESEINEYFLRRIHLRELAGWPPIIAPLGGKKRVPPIADCRLKAVRLKADGQPAEAGMEFDLEHEGGSYKAWMVECPLPLLYCVQATLEQANAVGKNVSDLQEMRLIAAEPE